MRKMSLWFSFADKKTEAQGHQISYFLKAHTGSKWQLGLEPLELLQSVYPIKEEAQTMEIQVGMNW